jgi:hypothetical protein
MSRGFTSSPPWCLHGGSSTDTLQLTNSKCYLREVEKSEDLLLRIKETAPLKVVRYQFPIVRVQNTTQNTGLRLVKPITVQC